MPIIYHIVTTTDWANQQSSNEYEADSLYTEGFIHCSTKSQIEGVLERYYQQAPDLLLLHVDEEKVKSKILYESSTNDELFPHVYGPITKDAVITVATIKAEGVLLPF